MNWKLEIWNVIRYNKIFLNKGMRAIFASIFIECKSCFLDKYSFKT